MSIKDKMKYHLDNYPGKSALFSIGRKVIATIDYDTAVYGKVVSGSWPIYFIRIESSIGPIEDHQSKNKDTVCVNWYEVVERIEE